MYDWDDLEVDNTLSHDSLHFFARRRTKHERRDEIDHLILNDDVPRIDALTLSEGSENVKQEKDSFCGDDETNNENKENVQEEIPKLGNPKTNVKEETTEPGNPNDKPKTFAKILTPSRFQKPTNGAIPKRTVPSERLTKGSNKREELLRKTLEKERKMREFHAIPMPNYKRPENKVVLHMVSVPKTPDVLKRSKEAEQKRLERLRKIEEEKKIAPFKAQEPKVVKEAPFVPKKKPTVIEVKPYNLRSNRRLEERKEFDNAVNKALEEKKKQEEEERKKLEEEHIKELRKATVFKARPNPFK